MTEKHVHVLIDAVDSVPEVAGHVPASFFQSKFRQLHQAMAEAELWIQDYSRQANPDLEDMEFEEEILAEKQHDKLWQLKHAQCRRPSANRLHMSQQHTAPSC